ncbi:helix-turn-helix domain-containing protein [Thomasclavelia cocleata]|uniref:helix-turn-helix domain-containing protein n=1 Tax=Thomasclavelia cocleata TaxID=69824 RepID=UPI00257024F0|nr:helix-turn-helix transcriptional regulator [Thomasclavelia cocleata]
MQSNLTQEELCEKVGISISYLSKIEAPNCNKSFSLDLLYRICDVLMIDIKKLFD